MGAAIYVLTLLVGITGAVSWMTNNPLILVVSLMLIPSVMQSVPWALSLPRDDEEEQERREQEELANARPIGFTADID